MPSSEIDSSQAQGNPSSTETTKDATKIPDGSDVIKDKEDFDHIEQVTDTQKGMNRAPSQTGISEPFIISSSASLHAVQTFSTITTLCLAIYTTL